jgi:hypothetical protein
MTTWVWDAAEGVEGEVWGAAFIAEAAVIAKVARKMIRSVWATFIHWGERFISVSPLEPVTERLFGR